MNMRFLCCVALCLLGAGSLDGQVIQIPKHLFKGKGQKAKMSCIPENGHTFVYWYQQKQNKELKFLIYFQRQEVRERIDFVKERFVAECPINSPCSLEIQFSEAGDSALYLCASSLSTALKCAFPSVHKPSLEPTRKQVPLWVGRKQQRLNGASVSHSRFHKGLGVWQRSDNLTILKGHGARPGKNDLHMVLFFFLSFVHFCLCFLFVSFCVVLM